MRKPQPVLAVLLAASVYTSVSHASPLWQQDFLSAIKAHPAAASAEASLQAQAFQTDAAGKPLYNPEIDGEIERLTRSDATTDFQFGVSQTIDWWDKGKARLSQAKADYAAQRYAYQTVLASLSADALSALLELNISSDLHLLALEQEQRLQALLALVEKRHAAGDVGELDVELTFLSLTQRLNETAAIEARMKRAEHAVKAYLPADVISQSISTSFWQKLGEDNIDRLIPQHPKVQQAYFTWQARRTGIKVAETATKADPTFGLYAGAEAREALIGVQFSVPLFVRNDFKAQVSRVSQQALAAESTYQSIKQQQQAAAMAAHSALRQFQQHLDRWVNGGQARVMRSDTLLQRQWELGDISTSDYLRALQQRTATLESGLTLKGQQQQSVIQWLQASGQLVRVLSQP